MPTVRICNLTRTQWRKKKEKKEKEFSHVGALPYPIRISIYWTGNKRVVDLYSAQVQ